MRRAQDVRDTVGRKRQPARSWAASHRASSTASTTGPIEMGRRVGGFRREVVGRLCVSPAEVGNQLDAGGTVDRQGAHTRRRSLVCVRAASHGGCARSTVELPLMASVLHRAEGLHNKHMRVLRIYHSGRDPQHRGRERALSEAGVEVTLVVPSQWRDANSERSLSPEPFRIVELPVRRSGDVNRHVYSDVAGIQRLLADTRPDVLDLHEEPFSLAARQWLRAAGTDLPVVMYSAQNIDKRFPPPFAQYEHRALQRASAIYPCSRQAASVLRGKGFAGLIEVISLGYDADQFYPGAQSVEDDEIVLVLAGRLVAEKGVTDAVRVLARVNRLRPARLVVRGTGAEAGQARKVAASLGVADRLEIASWQTTADIASVYRSAHVVLVPSYPTTTWAEQFGRVIVEAQACGAVVAGYANGAIPEVAGGPGVLVPTGRVDELGTRVAELVGDQGGAWVARRVAGQREAAGRTWQAVAKRQVALYAAVTGGRPIAPVPPRSPRRRRVAARREFGSTAPALHGDRPFALPVLREGGPVADLLAAICDIWAEVAAYGRR